MDGWPLARDMVGAPHTCELMGNAALALAVLYHGRVVWSYASILKSALGSPLLSSCQRYL